MQHFFFFWTDLPPCNRFDFLWSCRFYLAYHHRPERRQEISTSFNFFLFEYTFSASFLFKNLTIVLFVFPSLWQATIRDLSRLIPISCKRRNMKFSRSFGATDLGMPEKSKHSLLVYCSSLWCCLSSSTSLLLVVLKASCKFSRCSVTLKYHFLALRSSSLAGQFWTLFPIAFSKCPCFVEVLYCLVMPRKMLLNSHCSFFPTVL